MPTAAEFAPETDPDPSATNHIIVAEHYEIDPDRPIGAGGMSLVYEGRDLKNRRMVAMRTLRAEHARDTEIRARFRKEARTMAFIQHPNVARVYDLWEDDRSAWVAMELVPGESLREVLAEHGPLPWYDIEPILLQSASALDKMHRAGMVHLDVKPANLIQTPDGTIKLIDFGLAQESNTSQELLQGLAWGSAAYLAPEQAAGETVGPASDVYSLGCVVYELLTGRTPFEDPYRERSAQEMVQAHLSLQPERPSDANPNMTIPEWCDELVIWALLKDPETRLPSPGLFAELFEQGGAGALSAADIRLMRSTRIPPASTVPVEPMRYIDPAIVDLPIPQTQRKQPILLRLLNPLRSIIWRLIVVMVLVNVLLAAVLYIQTGSIPGIISRSVPALEAGKFATVATDGLNLRMEAGVDAPSIGTLRTGESIYLRGNPVSVGGERWWPVTLGDPNNGLDGFVWENGLERGTQTIRERIDDGIDRTVDRIREKTGV